MIFWSFTSVFEIKIDHIQVNQQKMKTLKLLKKKSFHWLIYWLISIIIFINHYDVQRKIQIFLSFTSVFEIRIYQIQV